MNEQEQRSAVVAEARSWLLTPYHHAGRIKGAGVDCLTLLAEVFERAGLVPHVDPGHYPPDWHLHRSEERYLDGVLEYARPVADPPYRPGDIALFRFGRCAAHGAIVVEWPRILHAYAPAGCVTLDSAESGELRSRFAGIYRLKGWN